MKFFFRNHEYRHFLNQHFLKFWCYVWAMYIVHSAVESKLDIKTTSSLYTIYGGRRLNQKNEDDIRFQF